ncbi:recombinase family protein [Labrys portucalensis]|uniref:Recombinase family protein n=1 Tax=Labrys neptuniae TaxID=376174 RepID=A0ABV6ZJW1_9HYPH
MAKQRGAIYARYSSDLQNDRSVEDQIALCRAFADRNDISIAQTFHDRARSGASVFGREGLLSLIETARSNVFDVIVVEALDRLSRDQEDLAGLYKRLNFLGIKIIAVHDGVADAVQIGVRGMLGSLYLADLANKTRRGLQGVVREGRHAGGRAYGYRPTPGKPGEMSIVDDEAAIIHQIFADYAAGQSPRSMAADLNARRVPPPRGSYWNASTINGNKERGHGILRNAIYSGRLVWNRVRMVRDPDTGKRLSRVNPESDWQTTDVPHLRIVPEDLWQAVKARIDSRTHEKTVHEPRARRLLSGLLRCGSCGSGMTITGGDRSGPRVQCSAYKESRRCDNGGATTSRR